MSSLFFFTSRDFYLNRDGYMGLGIQGVTFVLFYSNECVYCRNFIPAIRALPENIQGCFIGMINVSQNKNIIEMSRHSTTPITFVPLMLLYYNGIPIQRYEGPPSVEKIRDFIIDTYSQLTFVSKDKRKSKPPQPYVLGTPNTDEVSSLEFNKAYI